MKKMMMKKKMMMLFLVVLGLNMVSVTWAEIVNWESPPAGSMITAIKDGKNIEYKIKTIDHQNVTIEYGDCGFFCPRKGAENIGFAFPAEGGRELNKQNRAIVKKLWPINTEKKDCVQYQHTRGNTTNQDVSCFVGLDENKRLIIRTDMKSSSGNTATFMCHYDTEQKICAVESYVKSNGEESWKFMVVNVKQPLIAKK